MRVKTVVRQQHSFDTFIGKIRMDQNSYRSGLLLFRLFYRAGESGLY